MNSSNELTERTGGFCLRELRKVLIDFYEALCPEQAKENLKGLFSNQPREEYYRRLKSTTEDREWEDFAEEISAGLSGGNMIGFHVLEGNDGEAVDLVVESESLRYLEGYLEEVAHYAYFETYADQLAPYLAGRRPSSLQTSNQSPPGAEEVGANGKVQGVRKFSKRGKHQSSRVS